MHGRRPLLRLALAAALLPAAAPLRGSEGTPPGDDRAEIRFFQDHGIPPSLFIIEPTEAGGGQARIELYELQPPEPTEVGRVLYRTLAPLSERDLERVSSKKLYVLLSLARELVAEEAKPTSAAFPERAEALRKRIRRVLALELPEDGDFAGLGLDPVPLSRALAERRASIDALREALLGRPALDEAARASRGAALEALRRMSAELGTLALDPDGAPLVPRGLYELVRATPESALTERQWRTLFCSYPMGRSLWDLRIDRLWRRALGGRGVHVAVLDTGVDATHPDLAGAVEDDVNLTNHRFTSEFRDASGRLHRLGEPDDRGEHATHVASTIHAIAPEAGIVNLKVLDEEARNVPEELEHDRTQTVTAIYDGLDWVLRHNRDVEAGRAPGAPIDIVNMSLGLPASGAVLRASTRDLLARKVKELSDAGVIVVVATGNEGDGTARTPGVEPSAVTVGAADAFGRKAPFSSNRSIVDSDALELYDVPAVWAPGVDVSAARFDPSGAYAGQTTAELHQTRSGTSMAAPHAAGVIALLLDEAKRRGIRLSPPRLQRLLVESSTPLAGENPYARLGGGEIDPNRALELLLKRYAPPPKE